MRRRGQGQDKAWLGPFLADPDAIGAVTLGYCFLPDATNHGVIVLGEIARRGARPAKAYMGDIAGPIRKAQPRLPPGTVEVGCSHCEGQGQEEEGHRILGAAI